MTDDLMEKFDDSSNPFHLIDEGTKGRMARLRAESVFAGAAKEVREAGYPSPSVPAEDQEAEDPAIKSLYAELEQAKADRDQAIAQIAILKSSKGNGSGHINPDGSLTLVVHINPDLVASLTPWEELEGTGIEETARKYIPVALEAFISGS